MNMVNELVASYQVSRNGELFAEIYRIVSTVWTPAKRRNDERFTYAGQHEVQAVYDQTLMDVIDKYDPSDGNFENFLTRSVRNRIKNLRRSRSRVREDCTLEVATDDGDTPISQIEDVSLVQAGNVEGTVIELQKKREQRQLLSILVTGADDITSRIVELYLAGQPYTAIAKSLGLSDKTVKNKLRYLSRRYDANRFGDPRNYYTV